jgi:hypothetical protein
LEAFAVFQEIENGALVSAAPRFTPSSWNCTLVTATLSAAVAETLTVLLTVAPLAGEETVTVGGVESAGAVASTIGVAMSAWISACESVRL